MSNEYARLFALVVTKRLVRLHNAQPHFDSKFTNLQSSRVTFARLKRFVYFVNTSSLFHLRPTMVGIRITIATLFVYYRVKYGQNDKNAIVVGQCNFLRVFASPHSPHKRGKTSVNNTVLSAQLPKFLWEIRNEKECRLIASGSPFASASRNSIFRHCSLIEETMTTFSARKQCLTAVYS